MNSGVLELVQLRMIGEQLEHLVDGATRQCTVTFGTGHEADEDRALSEDEGRDAEDAQLVDGALVLLTNCLRRPSVLDLRENRVGIHTGNRQRGAHHLGVAKVTAGIVARREEGPVDGRELIGKPVPYDNTGAERKEVGLMGGVLP